VDTANDELVRAVALALCHEAPSAWRDDLAGALQNETRLAPLLGLVMGYRRIPAEDLLRRTLTQDLPVGRSTLAWALGRVGTPASVPALSSVLEGNDEALSEAAAIALMRVKARTPLAVALDAAESRAWAKRVLAIGGNNRVVRVLLNLVRNGQADANAVLALGLLGDLSAVAPLLDLLENDALVEPAATALNVITGARLHSKVFVPDTFDPDEFFGRERAAYEKDGTLPTRHGQPFGNWERRPLRDKQAWRAWLDENKHHFSRELRWRMGKPYGPSALVECLACESSPYAVREATCEELVVRYRLDVPFEIELPVARQLRVLETLEAWAASHSADFAEGQWYFAGELQS